MSVIEKIAVISPCYNEEQNISNFLKSLHLITKNFNYKCYTLLVDDGSTDNTWLKIKQERKKYQNLKGLKLTRNFGKDRAIDAALNYLDEKYKFFIIIDVDLQHPINVIKDLIKNFENKKVEVVNTFRIDKKEGILREFFSKIFYKILVKFSDIKIISKTTDFMLISQKVRDEFIKINEIDKTFRVLISWLGFDSISLPIKINYRTAGKSKYNYFNLFRLAINTFSSYSILPIKLIGYLGLLMSLLACFSFLFFLINFYFNFTILTWQTQIIVLQIFLTGLTMASVGLLGIYVTKILNNTNKRPSYIIEEEIK